MEQFVVSARKYRPQTFKDVMSAMKMQQKLPKLLIKKIKP